MDVDEAQILYSFEKKMKRRKSNEIVLNDSNEMDIRKTSWKYS